MSVEVERRFLVNNDSWKQHLVLSETRIMQGYISTDPGKTVLIRLVGLDCVMTIKGKRENGRCVEFEYAIPQVDFVEMVNLLDINLLSKVRYKVKVGSHIWEIDVFNGHLEGLVVAELNIPDENCRFIPPLWLGKEVTDELSFDNNALVSSSFSEITQAEEESKNPIGI